MGTIREKRPGRFELRAYIGRSPSGSPLYLQETYVHHRSDGGKRIAKEKLRDLEVRAAKARAEGTTFSALLGEWLAHAEQLGRSPTTLRNYRLRVERISADLGDLLMDDMTARHLDSWYGQLLTQGLTPANVVQYHRVVSAALRQGERWGVVAASPARNARPPTVTRHRVAPPTPDQVATLARLAEESRATYMGGVILWAALTGMRRGELCGLRWPDIDLKGGKVTVVRSVYQAADEVGLKGTKTHQARTVALDPVAVEVLKRRRARADEAAHVVGIALDPGAYVWSDDPEGVVPLRPDTVTQAFGRLCRKAEQLEKRPYPFRLHDLRHYSATELLAAGVDLATVSGRLGHERISTTSDIYVHGRDGRDETAAAVLGGQLRAALHQ